MQPQFGFAFHCVFQSVPESAKLKQLELNEDEIIELAKPVLKGWTVAQDSDIIALAQRRIEGTKKEYGSTGASMSLRGLWFASRQEEMRYSVSVVGWLALWRLFLWL